MSHGRADPGNGRRRGSPVTVTWASIASATEMGQQRYESEIQRAIRRVADDGWTFKCVTVAPVRSSIEGARRVPARLVRHAPLHLSRLTGLALYGSTDLVHRFDLRLPAAWGREVVTVHDLPPLRFADEGDLPCSAIAGARRARSVIAPSEFARNEIVELLGAAKVDVVPYGLSPEYAAGDPATDAELDSLGIRGPFVLHAAGATRRKNLSGLADAWRDLAPRRPELSLVLCGPSDARRDALFANVPRVVRPGRLEASVVAGLMRRAAVVVVPSIYEGFGLPALEGMACAACVVAAKRGALPEVCGDAALLVEPNGRGLAAGIERVLTDPDLAARLRQAGPPRARQFDWETAALEHLRVYREALGDDHSGSSR